MKGSPLISPRHLVRRFSPALVGTQGLVPGLHGPPPRSLWAEARGVATLGRIGDLEVRLATSGAEVRRAQSLRYRVFYDEMSAIPDPAAQIRRRDVDAFDRICDHLLVVDHAITRRGGLRSRPETVGTYRLLRQEIAERNGGFYTAGEYDIAPLVRAHPDLRFLELGRSCVLQPYRNKRTVELLWHGIWAYVLRHEIDVLFGCASLEGTDPDRLALPLSFLHHHARPPAEWSIRALPHRRVEMNRMAADAIDARAALGALPPLIKGYLRLGAYIGDGAVVDRQFGTTDVCIILPRSAISPRYINYYGPAAERHAV